MLGVHRRYIGYLAYEQQQVAKELAHVITGRMYGAIAVVSPGEDIDVGVRDAPREYGVSSPDEATEKVRSWGRRGYEIADVDVGAFAPYSAVEEYSRRHVFMGPAADYAKSASAGREALAYAEGAP